MKFFETKLNGLYIIELDKFEDNRGFFARSWDSKIFEEKGLNSNCVQANISSNKKRGTLRGMHYQKNPFAEVKFVRCTKGRVFQVAIDLRKESKTYKQWISVELSENNYKMFYVPEGFALGFQALDDNCELSYQVSQFYTPEYESGIRWNDPMFKINWPLEPTVISQKDSSWPDFKE